MSVIVHTHDTPRVKLLEEYSQSETTKNSHSSGLVRTYYIEYEQPVSKKFRMTMCLDYECCASSTSHFLFKTYREALCE